jgi:hypothetical protein
MQLIHYILRLEMHQVFVQHSTITDILSNALSTDIPTNFSVVIIAKSDLQGRCKLQMNLHGKVVLYNGDIWDPILFHTCVYNDYAPALLFTSWAQDAGAVAVINKGRIGQSGVKNTFCLFLIILTWRQYGGGRMVGFNEHIKIPYIIIEPTNIEFLVASIKSQSLTSLELEPRSAAGMGRGQVGGKERERGGERGGKGDGMG